MVFISSFPVNQSNIFAGNSNGRILWTLINKVQNVPFCVNQSKLLQGIVGKHLSEF